MRFLSKRLGEFIVEQKCVPWRFWPLFAQMRNRIFNLNTKKYWDKVWSKEVVPSHGCREMQNLYRKIISIVPEGSMLLDVGCGAGVFMKQAREVKKCRVFGIDISESAINHVIKSGMDGAVKRIPPIPCLDESYDVIVSTELLEHVGSPRTVTEELLRVCKGGGLVCFSVPESCLGPLEEREHLHTFTRESIYSLLARIKHKIDVSCFTIQEDGQKAKRLLVVCRKSAA